MRLIDADVLIKWLEDVKQNRFDKFEVEKIINFALTIDAVEAVKCKDCKWADWYKTADGEQFCYCIETGNGGRTANDYCSYGERREP